MMHPQRLADSRNSRRSRQEILIGSFRCLDREVVGAARDSHQLLLIPCRNQVANSTSEQRENERDQCDR